VLLVDGQPLGAGGELCMALDAARVRGVHAVLRARDGVAEIPDVYDHVLVYGRSHARLTARHLLEIAASGRESGGPG
jgi:hypothetical protein